MLTNTLAYLSSFISLQAHYQKLENKMKSQTIKTLFAVSAIALSTQQALAKDSKKEVTLQQLKAELQALKDSYQSKIAELEKRLAETEVASVENQTQLEETQENVDELAIDISQQANQKRANTFNPGIGVILNGKYVNYKNGYEYQIPGFFPAEEIGPGEQGLQLGESELNLNANIDDKFYGSITLAFGEGEAAVEEAYLQSLNLGNGFNIKAGRFFSDIGYLNNKHAHTDDFANRPLPYEAFLDGKYGDDGVQVTWLAPTDLYWESGVELYRGESYPSAGAGNSGKGVWTAFSHLGGDIGNSQSWRAGLSYLHADVDGLSSEEGDQFTGKTKLWIADFIYKWSPEGNRLNQEFKLQGEYLYRNQQGLFSNNLLTDASVDRNQSGWYLEGVYKFTRQWRVGLRTSRLHADTLPVQFADTLLGSKHSPKQHAFMIDWTNSEFSRIRFEYDLNNLNGENDNVWTLQYIAAFGAHGAHSF